MRRNRSSRHCRQGLGLACQLVFLASGLYSVTSLGANIGPFASQVTASSQSTATGQTAAKAVDGVIDGYPGDYTREWATKGGKAGSWLRLDWASLYTVNRVVLYDRPNGSDQVLSGRLLFSDGSTVQVAGPLPNDGAPLEVSFTSRSVSWIRFNIDSVSAATLNVGLAEMEIDGASTSAANTPPVINQGPVANPESIYENQITTLSVTANDPEGDPLTYVWQPESGTITGSGPVVTFIPPAVNEDTVVRINLTVSDPSGLTATGFVDLVVRDSLDAPVNISPLASSITASSQNTATGQTALKAVDGVVDGYPGDYTKEWATVKGKAGSWLRLEWPSTHTVGRVVLYDRPNDGDQMLSGTLSFSDGTSVSFGALPNNGAPLELTFPPRDVLWVKLTADTVSPTTLNIGLAEIEVYGASAATTTSAHESIMVVVAHPDDETLTSAGILKQAIDEGDAVKVVIVTNGDFNNLNKGYLREEESRHVLSDVLGINENDIIFLGYPDAGMLNVYNDYPNAVDSGYISTAGQTKTYGNKGLAGQDFHRYRTGAPADYNRANVVSDLRAILNRYRPDKIYTHSPVDQHWDHRASYYLLREAAVLLMREEKSFRPQVYVATVHNPKNYPYSDKWLPGAATLSPFDFSSSTYWPNPAFSGTPGKRGDAVKRFTPGIPFNEPPDLYRSMQAWADRVSMAVPSSMLVADLQGNLKFNMIDGYVSQYDGYGFTYAYGKNEEIFWFKDWSRNIAMTADITASSENTALFQNAANVADGIADGFRDANNDGISEGNNQAEWATMSERGGAWINLSWPSPQVVTKVVFYDRPNAKDQIISGTLQFSDGTNQAVNPQGGFPNDGKPITVTLPAAKTVSWLRFSVGAVSASTQSVGLSEMEVISNPPAGNRAPYFVRGPMAGSYALTAGANTGLSAPAYDVDGDSISYSWEAQVGSIVGTGSQVTYKAPTVTASTIDIIKVSIFDGHNSPVMAQFALSIAPVGTTGINIAPVAILVSASSQNNATGQTAMKAVDGVIDGYPGDYTKEWATVKGKAGSWIRLDWAGSYVVDRVILYERPNTNDRASSGRILFSNGTSVSVGTLPDAGEPLEVLFPPRTTKWIQFVVDSVSSTTVNVGLAELKVFGAAVNP